LINLDLGVLKLAEPFIVYMLQLQYGLNGSYTRVESSSWVYDTTR